MNNEIYYSSVIHENIPNESKTAMKTIGYYFLLFIVGMNLLLLIGAIWGMAAVEIFNINFTEDQFNNLVNDVSIFSETIFGFIGLWWLYYYTRKNGLLTLRKIKITGFDLLLILSSYFIMIGAAYFLDVIFSFFEFSMATPENQKLVEEMLRTNPIQMIVSAVILAPIKEEWITRKLIIGSIFKNFPFIGLLVSSFGFGLLHMIAGFSIYALIQYSLAGLVFGLIYLKTRRIEVCILAHFLNNFISVVAFYFMN